MLTAQQTVHFSGWSDVCKTLWIFRRPELRAPLVHEPIEVEIGFITKPQAV
jgi:hypothetical protein